MPTPATIQGLDFIMLPTQDLARAAEFYRDVLGLELDSQWKELGVEFKLGPDLTLAILDVAVTGREFSPHVAGAVALRVADFEGSVKALEAKGITFFGEPIDSGVCKMAFFQDPDGNSLMLHHRYAP